MGSPEKKVTRFSGLSALFIDRIGKGRNFYSNISQTLPNLHWQGYRYIPQQEPFDDLPETDLVFILNNGLLQLEDQNRSPIRSYPVAAKDLQVSIQKTSGLSPEKQIRQGGETLVKTDQGGQATKSISLEMSWSPNNLPMRFDEKFPGFDQIATLNEKILMTDFLERENGLLLATTDGTYVRVFRFTDKLIPIAEYRSSALERIHTVQWWQPEAKDELLLSVTASRSGDARVTSTEELVPSSFILKFNDDQLSLFKNHLNYFLGTFDLDEDGRRETLLGQYFDIDRFFGNVKRLEFKDDHFIEQPAPANIKKRLPVTQGLLVDTTGNGQKESIYIRSGGLRIYQKEKLLQSIDEVAGGSLSVVTYDKTPGQIDSLFETESFELPPVAVDIDGDSVSEVLVVTSERTGLFSFGSTPDIESSRIEILKNQGGRFLTGTLSKLPGVFIQGIYANKNRLLIVAVAQGSGEDKPVSYLLSRSFTDKE